MRMKAQSLARMTRTIGPHPIVLLRTFAFLAGRRRRTRRLRALYSTPLSKESVDLRLPTVGLAPIQELPDELRIAATALREEADQVLAHRIDLLGSGLVDLGAEIDWHKDFKSGYVWPRSAYDELEVTRLHDSSDAKVPWELSRLHHLLTLARAARMFEAEHYARELETQISSWLDDNPPAVGINWVNPMEVAIRAVNLVWALATLEEWRPLEASLRDRLIESLRWHGRHIRANLEGTPYLRSNHYLSDILGLLVLGWVLNGEPEAPKWFGFARREFEREILRQVHPDGVSFEASLAYHGLVLEILLIARHVAAQAEQPFSARFDDRLRRMLDVSRTVRHDNGRTPLFGDQDSGRILPGGFARPATHDNLLWSAATELGERRPLPGPVHPEAAWTFGVTAWLRAKELPAPVEPRSAAFAAGGLYVLRSARIQVVIRFGDVGQNGLGGHSHNDMLSYELSVDGVPLIIDSGTYAYTFDVAARNAFRSTRAHNTLVVDGEEIQPIDEDRVFELRRFARPRVETLRLDGDALELVGTHDGYRRRASPVLHRRRFSLNVTSEELTVHDEVVGRGEHILESFLHFAAGVALQPSTDGSYAVASERANGLLVWSGIDPTESHVEQGWVSSSYGTRERAPVIVAKTRRRCPATISYSLGVPATDRR